MAKVSVVIPVFDSEAWLRECLDSVISQTLRDIEVVCVDDGSADSSPEILAEYAAKDLRIKVIRESNAGAGAARNAGMDAASGEWLSFLDSDDVFAPQMLSEMVVAGECSGADVVAYTALKRGDMFHRWKGWAWDKLFRRDFIAARGLRFQNLPVSNDLCFTYSALVFASKVEPIGKSYAFHRKRPGSVETMRDRTPLAPAEAVCALYDHIGLVEGFAEWVPDFLFWHVNRFNSPVARRILLDETRRIGREWNIDRTPKWWYEELKHLVRRIVGRLGS